MKELVAYQALSVINPFGYQRQAKNYSCEISNRVGL